MKWRRYIRRFAGVLVTTGLLALLGTAGASDRELIALPQILAQAGIGLLLVVAGVFGLRPMKGGRKK